MILFLVQLIFNASTTSNEISEVELKILEYQEFLKNGTFYNILINKKSESLKNIEHANSCNILFNEFFNEIKKILVIYYGKCEDDVEDYIRLVGLQKEENVSKILSNIMELFKGDWEVFQHKFKRQLIIYLEKYNNKITSIKKEYHEELSKFVEKNVYFQNYSFYYTKIFNTIEIGNFNISNICKSFKIYFVDLIIKYYKIINFHLENQIFIYSVDDLNIARKILDAINDTIKLEIDGVFFKIESFIRKFLTM